MAIEFKEVPNQPLADKAIVLSLEFGKISNRRRLESTTDDVETEIDRKMLHLGVDLFDAPELRACQNYQAKLKKKIRHLTVPSFFRGGMFLVKHEAVDTVDTMLQEATVEFKPLVEAFASVVDQRRDEAIARLSGSVCASDYPSRDLIREAYRIEWNWLTMSTPAALKAISTKIFEREREKAEEQIKTATAGITSLLAFEAKSLADHLIEKLQPSPDGTKKRLHKTTLSNITEFLDTFKMRNIGDSAELDAQIEKIRELSVGIDTKSLKDSEALRESVTTDFSKVSAALASLVSDRPRRFMAKAGEEA